MTAIVFVTHAVHPEGTADDALAAAALRRRGFEVAFQPWTATDVTGSAALVLRSTWDYHQRLPEFERWLADVEQGGARLINPAPLVRWNAHKRYLCELADRGLAVVPTEIMPRGGGGDIRAIFERRSWSSAVVKPAVSAGGSDTLRLERPDLTPEVCARLALLNLGADLLVQPFLPEIDAGELSFVFFAGVYSHALRKRPRTGEFRVQTEHGGSVEAYVPSPAFVAQARRFLEACSGTPVYARVDAVETTRGLELMELELIEPELFFRLDDGAPERFAAALTGALDCVGASP